MEHMAPAHYRRYPDISLAETSRGHPAPVPGPCLISCWGGGREGEGRRITARLLPEAVWLPHRPPHTASTGCQKLGTICNFFLPSTQEYFFCPAWGVNCDVDDVVNIKLVTVTIKKCKYLFSGSHFDNRAFPAILNSLGSFSLFSECPGPLLRHTVAAV